MNLNGYSNIFTLALLLSGLLSSPVSALEDKTLICAAPVAQPGASGTVVPRASGYHGYNGVPGYYVPGAYSSAVPYANPYYQNYPGQYPYYNPYAPTYLGRYNIGGVIQPVFGPPQLVNGNYYGIAVGGNPYTYWRAPSGFYYPWVGGSSYSDNPTLVMPPGGSTPLQTQPPITTVITDLTSYLDKAKEEGKISNTMYQELKNRLQNLRSKEQSMAKVNDGVLDPDEEVEVRKELNTLSAEVAYHVNSKSY